METLRPHRRWHSAVLREGRRTDDQRNGASRQTLTASTSGISDADGLTNVSYSYQWLADDTAIERATGSTHTVQLSDDGKVIKVQVTFTDDAGNDESLTSAGTAAVVMGGL